MRKRETMRLLSFFVVLAMIVGMAPVMETKATGPGTPTYYYLGVQDNLTETTATTLYDSVTMVVSTSGAIT